MGESLTASHGELLLVIKIKKKTMKIKQQQVKLPSQKALVCFKESVDILHKLQSCPTGLCCIL